MSVDDLTDSFQASLSLNDAKEKEKQRDTTWHRFPLAEYLELLKEQRLLKLCKRLNRRRPHYGRHRKCSPQLRAQSEARLSHRRRIRLRRQERYCKEQGLPIRCSHCGKWYAAGQHKGSEEHSEL